MQNAAIAWDMVDDRSSLLNQMEEECPPSASNQNEKEAAASGADLIDFETIVADTASTANSQNEGECDLIESMSSETVGGDQPKTEDDDETQTQQSGGVAATAAVKFHFKLSDLCQYLLGKALDKSEQFSNWARRPLRPAQKHYAALDAHCQLAIYERLRERATLLGIDFEQAVRQSTIGPPKDRSLARGSSAGAIDAEYGRSKIRKWMERQELMEMIKV